MITIRNYTPIEHHHKIAHHMSVMLVDEYVVATITKHAQNLMDAGTFNKLHKCFQGQCVQIDRLIQKIADFIRSIGHYAPETPHAFMALERLTHIERQPNDCTGFIAELLNEHETIIEKVRANSHIFSSATQHPGSSQLNNTLIRSHTKMAWFLRNYN